MVVLVQGTRSLDRDCPEHKVVFIAPQSTRSAPSLVSGVLVRIVVVRMISTGTSRAINSILEGPSGVVEPRVVVILRGRPLGLFLCCTRMSEAEAEDEAITGMISICHHPASTIFDPGSLFSYVFMYFFVSWV